VIIKMKLLIKILAISILFASELQAQQKADRKKDRTSKEQKNLNGDGFADYYNDGYKRYGDYVYDPLFRTIQLHKEGWEQSPPVIEFGKGEKLELHFDHLVEERTALMWTVIHCNADWTPSSLNQSEYLASFTEDYIVDSEFSFNTIQKYVHYSLVFPNENMRITKSGNYMLFVYPEGMPDNPVFGKRFLVVSPAVTIEPNLKPATTPDMRQSHQELDFTIQSSGYRITDPYDALKVTIMQNFDWSTAVYTLKPRHVKDSEIVYDYHDINVFPGIKEYRYFDTRSLRLLTDRVVRYDFVNDTNIVVLRPDVSRRNDAYLSNPDINGRYAIRNTEGMGNHLTEADYTEVLFQLQAKIPITFGSVYIIGDLVNQGKTSNGKLQYNYETSAYETSLYLKQGYYNYLYKVKGQNIDDDEVWFFEGSSRETENEYQIIVYYRDAGSLHDKIIGYRKVSSVGR